ncbi:reverse transcriptase domain-containing protein [Tanacetum coccineum]
MAKNRTMEELLRAPTEGYGEAIVIPEINADHFEIKVNLLQLVQANPFHGSFFQNQASTSGTLPSNTIPNPKGEMKAITTRSGVAYEGPSIPTNPSPKRLNDQKLREKATNQMEKFFQIFQDLHFNISFADALLLMPKFASIIKTDLGARINLMPLSIWKNLSLPELTPTLMTLELADRSITRPKGVAEDVFVKVRKFHFPTNFVVVDFDADPWVPLILGRSFLRTSRALIDVYGEEITLRVNDEAVTFNLNQTTRYSSTYDDMSVNRIDIIDVACEEYAQEVLGFSNNSTGGNLTPTSEPIISDSSLSLTPFKGSDFILEEIGAYLKDDSISPEIDHADFDPEGDICLIEKLLNNDPFQLPPMDLKQAEVTKGTDKLPVIIAKSLKDDEKEALLKVASIHIKQAIAWKITDIKSVRKLNEATRKDHFSLPFMDQMLERLAGNEFYCFLDGFSGYFQILIDPQDQEKTTFTCPYGTFAYRRMPFGLCNAPGTFQRCMMAIFHDMIEKTMEVFMDDFSVFGDSFASCLSNLDKMLKRCEDTNLVLNWEKCHFMCKEGIVLGHKISKSGIEVDRAKVDVIAKLPHPTTVKGVRSFLDAPFVFSQDCIDAFETLKKKLTEAPILVVPDWNLPFELMCDASDFAIGAVLGQQAKALPTNDARVVVKFLKSLFAQFGTPRAIISDRGTYFCNDKFAKVMYKYGVIHLLATAYHPQMSGQVEVLNRGLKRILERTVGENRASWSDKLDDVLWAFRLLDFQDTIGCTHYKLVYGKSCHLPIELEHKAYWALKHANFDLKTAGDHRKLQLNELNELRDQAYKNSLIYKERTKKLHDSKIKNRIFNVGDRVLLFNSRLKIFLGKLKNPITLEENTIEGCPGSPNHPHGQLNAGIEINPNFWKALVFRCFIRSLELPKLLMPLDSSRMFLSQKKYAVEILERAHMVTCNPSRTPIDTESKLGADSDPVFDPTLYRSLASSLQYFTFTRPDISYAVHQGTLDYGLQLFSSSTTNLVAYSDLQLILSRSSAEAEYHDVANAVAETFYLSCNPVQHQRTKHIDIDIHFVRDLVVAGRSSLSVCSPPAPTAGEC